MRYVLLIVLLLIPAKLKNHVIEDIDLDKPEEIIYTNDLKCLTDNIYHEAKGESLKGKLAVAQVTINRVNAKGFPGNICDVVYERKFVSKKRKHLCQFSWTCQKVSIDYNEHYEDSMLIADAVLNNDVVDERTKNSLFFHADYVNPKWKMKPIAKIGKHIFY